MDDWKKKSQAFIEKASVGLTKAGEVVKSKMDESGVSDAVSKAALSVGEALDKSGISETASKVSSVVGDEFDSVSGKKIFNLLQKNIEIQKEYNDVLASKLEEALNRIKQLEDKIK